MMRTDSLLRRFRADVLLQWSLQTVIPAVTVGVMVFWYCVKSSVPEAGLIAATSALLVAALVAYRRRDSFPTLHRVARHLDQRFSELQDSAELLLRRESDLTLIARAQRRRVAAVLRELAQQGQLQWRGRRTLRWLAIGLMAIAVSVNLPWMLSLSNSSDASRLLPRSATAIRSWQIDERPAPYTGLSNLAHERMSVDVHEFSQIRWTVAIDGEAERVLVRFDDSTEVILYAGSNSMWQSPWVTATAGNYQLIIDQKAYRVADSLAHAVVLIPDLPPQVRLIEPEIRVRELQEGADGSLAIRLRLEDDFGVDSLEAVATTATGDGEQVVFSEQKKDLTTEIDSSGSTLVTNIDLLAMGATPGSELYVSFVATDRRPDEPNRAESASLIIRWAEAQRQADIVLDNQIVAIEPEYFRSQRQIIIDSEALLEKRPTLKKAEFDQGAQSLAFDERALRFRYGKFMGEESSGEPAAGRNSLQTSGGHFVGDGHDHGNQTLSFGDSGGGFGDVMAAIQPYAHFHDQEEQATLFDPETRLLLGQALAAMWRAEGFLLQQDPEASLPHQYRALALIKRVQNRSRSFENRVGVNLTPVDLSRRYEGELDDVPYQRLLSDGVADRAEVMDPSSDVLALIAGTADADGTERVRAWASSAISSAQSDRNIARERHLRDLLNQLTAIDADPGCGPCRDAIGGAWVQLVETPVPTPARRREPRPWFGEGGDD